MSFTRLIYKIDVRKLYQIIHGFVKNETSETWINPKESKQDGRLDYIALLAHYWGKSNKTVQIKEVEALTTSLVYKNDRAMSFKKFLTNMQKMFTGLSKNG